MRKLLLVTTALFALTGAARADVVLTQSGMNGTGTNVVFDSEAANGMSAVGHLNNNTDLINFTDLSATPWTSAASSGNDIKITGATDIGIQAFLSNDTTLIGTSKQVFSLKGTGNISLVVNAVDANGVAETPFSFASFAINNSQNFFILDAINGEVMTGLEIKDSGGTISDFEHYRIDAAAIPLAAAVPEASTWLMFLLGFASIGGISMLRRRETGRAFRLV